MKKTVSLILALVMCISLCACGSNSKNTPDPNENKILITSDMEDRFIEVLATKIDRDLLKQMNTFATNRKNDDWEGWRNFSEFTRYTTTDMEMIDSYTARVYGKVFGNSVYGDPISCNFQIDAWCEEDEQKPYGFSVEVSYGLTPELN